MFVGMDVVNVCWLDDDNANSYDYGNADWYGGSMIYGYDEWWDSITSVASDDDSSEGGVSRLNNK